MLRVARLGFVKNYSRLGLFAWVMLYGVLAWAESVAETSTDKLVELSEDKASVKGIVVAPASQESMGDFTKHNSKGATYNEDLNKLTWTNPSLGFKDLGLDLTDIQSLVGDRIVLFMHKPKTIEVPYYGEMVRWHNARFVSAVTEVPVSAEKLRELIIKNDQENGWKDVEPFVRSTKVVYSDDQNQVGLHYKIQGKLSIIRVNGNIYARNRYEENGDISSLFLMGDIGVALGFVPIIPKAVLSPLAVANVRRWEFIPISENRSLVAITDWAEVMNDSPLSKRMSQYEENSGKYAGLSDEDLVGPFPGVAVNMYNFKHAVMRQLVAGSAQDESERELGRSPVEAEIEQVKGEVPDFIGTLPKSALKKALSVGPVVFVHPKQKISTDYGGYPLHFVTTAYPVNAKFEDLRRYSARMNHYADYVPQLSSSTLEKGTFDIPDFTAPISEIPDAEVAMKMSLGRRAKFISSFNIEYLMRYFWQRPDRLSFEAIGGEIETVQGAVEWLATSEEESILFYTSASDLGPNPKFPLSLTQKIPGADIASGVIVSTMAAGRQGPWVESQIAEETSE